jgi:hypothetical protein
MCPFSRASSVSRSARAPVVAGEHPLGRLLMPQQRVADDGELVLLRERHQPIDRLKVVLLRFRVHPLPLEGVLGRDGVEVVRDEATACVSRPSLLRLVERRSDEHARRHRSLSAGSVRPCAESAAATRARASSTRATVERESS